MNKNYADYEAFEIVSPYYTIEESPKILQSFKKEVFDFFKVKTDDSTGGHINILRLL